MNRYAALGGVFLLLIGILLVTFQPASQPPTEEGRCVEWQQLPDGFVDVLNPFNWTHPLYPNLTLTHRWVGNITYPIRTNSHGLREQPFPTKKPANTTRILVLGNSRSFGIGIEQEELFTEVLEQRLDAHTATDYQIINVGIPNWGMRDYYRYLTRQGYRFQPDILMIVFTSNDRISSVSNREVHEKSEERARAEHNFSEMTAAQQRQAIRDEYLELQYRELPGALPPNQTDFTYLNNLSAFAEQHGIPDIYIGADILHPPQIRYVKQWANTTDNPLFLAPDRLSRFWANRTEGGCLQKNPYRLSRFNGEYSARGHRVLADFIYNQTHNILLSQP